MVVPSPLLVSNMANSQCPIYQNSNIATDKINKIKKEGGGGRRAGSHCSLLYLQRENK